MYGGERNLITINMSEFQEAHTVSTLKGSPPGYVGYGEGGVLTEAVRRHPYSVVLLDEVEKARREIDFKNTIILLTSNTATDTMMQLCADPETMPTPEGIVKAIKPELNKTFKPAFPGRLVVIPYYPVRDEALIDEIARRCTEVESGARNVDNILTNTLLPEISRRILARLAERQKPAPIHVTIGENGAFVYN